MQYNFFVEDPPVAAFMDLLRIQKDTVMQII